MFKIGDRVHWWSAAGGGRTTKNGEIVAIVPPGKNFRLVEKELAKTHKFRSAYGGGNRRAHESFVVLVPPAKGNIPMLYWPRVSALRKT